MAVETLKANGIEIAYETFGAPDARPLLLVMGLGAQMLVWHDELCGAQAGGIGEVARQRVRIAPDRIESSRKVPEQRVARLLDARGDAAQSQARDRAFLQ